MRLAAWVAFLALVTSPVCAAAKPSARWTAHCAVNLEGARLKPTVVRKYCACMGDVGDEKEMLTWSQTDLERSYPPAHRQCFDKARGRRAKPLQ
jgi:hypothetical protein